MIFKSMDIFISQYMQLPDENQPIGSRSHQFSEVGVLVNSESVNGVLVLLKALQLLLHLQSLDCKQRRGVPTQKRKPSQLTVS